MTKLALGVKVRTGKAILVVLRGPATKPDVIIAKGIAQVAFTFEEGAVFHTAQDMTLAQARRHIERAEARFTQLARLEVQAILQPLDFRRGFVRLVAPAPKSLPPLETCLRSHPLVHSAEIELYRRCFSAACTELGLSPKRVEATAASVASSLNWNERQVHQYLSRMGKATGPPWTTHQKVATLAAWSALSRHT